MNKSRNNYVVLENYDNKCPSGYHYHPDHPKSNINGCMKDIDMKEKFGAFSIGAALKTPIRYNNNDYTENPLYIGVD
jgi:hypothetical protein